MNAAWAAQSACASRGREGSKAGPRVRITANSCGMGSSDLGARPSRGASARASARFEYTVTRAALECVETVR
jgi:hypothetical protein